jgi:hypothetical protein
MPDYVTQGKILTMVKRDYYEREQDTRTVAFLFLLGIISFGLVLLFGSKTLSVVTNGVEVNGKVARDTAKGQLVYELQTTQGQKLSYSSFWAIPEKRLGETVPIIYNAGNPGHASVNNFMELWFLPSLFLSATVISLLLGFFMARGKHLPKPKRQKNVAI